MIVAPSPFNTTNQELIFALAAELRLPAVYPFRYFPENGGLASYASESTVDATYRSHVRRSQVKNVLLCGESLAAVIFGSLNTS